jgi:hypothetical protein
VTVAFPGEHVLHACTEIVPVARQRDPDCSCVGEIDQPEGDVIVMVTVEPARKPSVVTFSWLGAVVVVGDTMMPPLSQKPCALATGFRSSSVPGDA